MRITNKEKLKMCEEHIYERKSLSHICERYGYSDVSKLKYWINLFNFLLFDNLLTLIR